jgi:hypothetical protein
VSEYHPPVSPAKVAAALSNQVAPNSRISMFPPAPTQPSEGLRTRLPNGRFAIAVYVGDDKFRVVAMSMAFCFFPQQSCPVRHRHTLNPHLSPPVRLWRQRIS